ncbi:MAG: hypothetical protein ACLFVZ_07685, partial [Actinomycetota bacterium]
MSRATLVRTAIFLATVVAAWAVLSLGSGAETPELEVGSPSPETFYADVADTVVDREATEQRQEEARQSVPAPREVDTEAENAVIEDIQAVFEDLERLAIGTPETETPDIPELPPEEETTTTTGEGEEEQPPAQTDPAILTGTVFVDIDGNGTFNPDSGEERTDVGIARVTVEVETHDDTFTVDTDENGELAVDYAGGPAVVVVDTDDPEVPDGYFV